MILEIFAFLCLIGAVILLITLSVIDLRIGLLPNIYNAALAACGIGFHLLTSFSWLSPVQIVLGAVVGGGMLWVIRIAANALYKQDTLGLGDVKLLAAGGLLLGLHGVLLAVTVGAMAGLVHGIGVIGFNKIKAKDIGKLSHFSIPAGPGFAVGIFAAAAYQYWPFIKGVFL